MKDLHVLKKLFWLCSLTVTIGVYAGSDLENYLSSEKNLIFDYQELKNQLEMDKLHNSWISPLNISYQESWSTQPLSGTDSSSVFSIGIDQPIFKSGGIYYAIKYAEILRYANSQDIVIQKRSLIAQAIDILYSLKKLKLQRKKLQYMIQNDLIDIRRKQENYDAGLQDSSFLDQAILKHNQDESAMLDLELNMATLKNSFAKLSRKNPDHLKTPHLKMISLKHYKDQNMEITAKKLRALEKHYSSKLIWASYMPTVSVNARYNDTDSEIPGLDDSYTTYGFKISVPLSINSMTDIESSRVSYMQAVTELQDSRRSTALEYDLVRKNLQILDRKIALAKKDEALYQRLYSRTRDLVKAGEKTKQDEATMHNSLRMKKLDREIYTIEKQQELLKLYTKVSH